MATNITFPRSVTVFDLPTTEVNKIAFVYRQFDPLESSSTDTYRSIEGQYNHAPPKGRRSIRIEITKSLNELSGKNTSLDELRSSLISHPTRISALLDKNIESIMSEVDLNAVNYSFLFLHNEDLMTDIKDNLHRTAVNKLTQHGITRAEFQHRAIQMVGGGDERIKHALNVDNDKVVIEPSTGNILTPVYNHSSKYAIGFNIQNDFLSGLSKRAAMNPYSPFFQDWSESIKAAILLQRQSRSGNNILMTSFDEHEIVLKEISDPWYESGYCQVDSGVCVFGFLITRRELDSAGEPIGNITVITNIDLDAKTFWDSNVKYGATYEYSIQTLSYARLNGQNFLVASKNGPRTTVQTIEHRPPPPPTDIYFNYTYNQRYLEIHWAFPVNTFEGHPINDVKAFQVFRRNSTAEPFALRRHWDFNDSERKYYHGPEKSITTSRAWKYSSIPKLKHMEQIKPDEDYIYAMASVDAHGNTSNYSEQYLVRFVSIKNKLTVKQISSAGAPKQYPNFNLFSDLTVDSIKTSGHKKLRIYFTPDAHRLFRSGRNVDVDFNGNSHPDFLGDVFKASQADINLEDCIPSHILQLINLDIQEDIQIPIYLRVK